MLDYELMEELVRFCWVLMRFINLYQALVSGSSSSRKDRHLKAKPQIVEQAANFHVVLSQLRHLTQRAL